jgi:hypothetical protein
MDKIRYGKWGAWIARVGVLLHLLAVITAQPGMNGTFNLKKNS